VNEERRKSRGTDARIGWRKRRRKGIHGKNVLAIKVVTWAQKANKSLRVSVLKLDYFFFLIWFGTNI